MASVLQNWYIRPSVKISVTLFVAAICIFVRRCLCVSACVWYRILTGRSPWCWSDRDYFHCNQFRGYIDWTEYVIVPVDSLPASARGPGSTRHLGQYNQSHNNLQLVSVVLSVCPGAPGQFRQQLTVEIQDFTMRTSSTKFSFVRARCSHAGLEYSIAPIDDYYKIGERLWIKKEKLIAVWRTFTNVSVHWCIILTSVINFDDYVICSGSNCVQQYQLF